MVLSQNFSSELSFCHKSIGLSYLVLVACPTILAASDDLRPSRDTWLHENRTSESPADLIVITSRLQLNSRRTRLRHILCKIPFISRVMRRIGYTARTVEGVRRQGGIR